MDTGFPGQDAESDFKRAKRRAALSRIARRLRGEPADVGAVLPFEEVVQALGRRGERSLGLQTIRLDSIVGSVDRSGREFDRAFRPTSSSVQPRWQRLAEAQRRGQGMPPIDVYRIGELHFVKDGHHRVSVARARGDSVIEAYVTEVLTEVGANAEITVADLPHKSHERQFFERVPLPAEARGEIRPSDPVNGYSELAEAVEAWGFRVMQATKDWMSRDEVAKAWLEDEYRPVVEMLRDAGLLEGGTETDAYMRIACRRWHLLRTHEWDTGVLDALK